MSNCCLTDRQKHFLRSIVLCVRKGILQENFVVLEDITMIRIFSINKDIEMIHAYSGDMGIDPYKIDIGFNLGALDVFCNKGLLIPSLENGTSGVKKFTLTQKAYDTVDSNFDKPDTSFVKYITPLADISHLDNELQQRCVSLLGAGNNNEVWDSVVRTAGVILEERLRLKGKINDPKVFGSGLVNKVFSSSGTLADKFDVDSERQGYRDMYAGIIGTFRNPSAHRLIDPTPEEGGTFIMFVDLLLKKLDAL